MLGHEPPEGALESLSVTAMRGAAGSACPRPPSQRRFGLLVMSRPRARGPWATGVPTPGRRSAALCALALGCCVATVAGAESAPGGCERFRSGGPAVERIEGFDLADPERAGVSFVELRYDPAYLRDPAVPPRPDGLPDREQLFSLDALTGAPPTARDRRGRTSPGRRGTVNVHGAGRSLRDRHRRHASRRGPCAAQRPMPPHRRGVGGLRAP